MSTLDLPVVHKRSSAPGAAPLTGDLVLGELAINTHDGKLYLKKNVGGVETVVEIGAGGAGGALGAIIQVPYMISESVAIAAGNNGFSPGPVVFADDDITVTIAPGSTWVIA